jgi:hypothetical protein
VLWNVSLRNPAIGGFDGGDAGQCQFLGQAILKRPEGTLGAATSLGRVGGDMLGAELLEGAADLGQLGLGNGFASLRRVEIVAAPVGIERTEQAVPFDHLTKTPEARGSALLVHQEG